MGDSTSTDLPGYPVSEEQKQAARDAARYYAPRSFSMNNPPSAVERVGTSVAIRNALRLGLPVGAVVVALVTAVGASVAYGRQSERVETNTANIVEVKSDVKDIGNKLEAAVTKLADQQAKQHTELIMLIYRMRGSHAANPVASPGSAP